MRKFGARGRRARGTERRRRDWAMRWAGIHAPRRQSIRPRKEDRSAWPEAVSATGGSEVAGKETREMAIGDADMADEPIKQHELTAEGQA